MLTLKPWEGAITLEILYLYSQKTLSTTNSSCLSQIFLKQQSLKKKKSFGEKDAVLGV